MAKKKKKNKTGFKGMVLTILFVLSAALFLPTTVFLFFAMLPTCAAYFADRKGGWKAITVGAMNMAGCTPFLLALWTGGNTTADALGLITNPLTVIVIFAAASIGFLIEWAMSGIVVTIMSQRAKMRLGDIEKRRKNLVERWGTEVAGDTPLDIYGFPLEQTAEEEERMRDAKKAEQK